MKATDNRAAALMARISLVATVSTMALAPFMSSIERLADGVSGAAAGLVWFLLITPLVLYMSSALMLSFFLLGYAALPFLLYTAIRERDSDGMAYSALLTLHIFAAAELAYFGFLS